MAQRRQTMRTASGIATSSQTPIRFSFDGKSYSGFAGDTLASALLANNVHLVGRSFKYHRPRGIMAAGAEEAAARARGAAAGAAPGADAGGAAAVNEAGAAT